MGHIAHRNHALDLGAGNLRDTRFMLDSGFKRVTALDSDLRTAQYAKLLKEPRLTMVCEDLHATIFPAGEFDLVNAQSILYFLDDVADLARVLEKLSRWLKPGGALCANLCGIRHEWHTRDRKRLLFLSREDAEALLSRHFDITEFLEHEFDAHGVMEKKMTHWHNFWITASKK
jgi:SAM-dependent methyltransferase